MNKGMDLGLPTSKTELKESSFLYFPASGTVLQQQRSKQQPNNQTNNRRNQDKNLLRNLLLEHLPLSKVSALLTKVFALSQIDHKHLPAIHYRFLDTPP